MATITLWNSVAKRRRSISDTFYDNGLATLKGYLEEKGHTVEIIDWAKDDFYPQLTPPFLARFLRAIYRVMLGTKNPLIKTVLGVLSLQLQELLSAIQQRRLYRRLDQVARELKEKQVRIVGVKIWYGEAFTNAKYLVKKLKEIAPEIITIAGGYHVTLYEDLLMRNSDFDLGVVCEGEFALEKILQLIDAAILPWNKAAVLSTITERAEANEIENLVYRKDGIIRKSRRKDMTTSSSKSIPKYEFSPAKVRIHVMVESLGCDWGKCFFCVHPHFYPRYSLRSPDEVVSEIQAMRAQGISVFRFAGSDTPPGFGAKIAAKIIEKKMPVIFGMGSRAQRDAQNHFEYLVDSYAALIRSGLRAVFMGGEAGNDCINTEVMNKGVTFSDIVHTVRALREAEKRAGQKVYLSLALIYPAPLLGKVSLAQLKEDNIRLLKETMPDSVMITPPGPFLHTSWYNEREKFGFGIDPDIIQRAMEYEYVLYKPPHLWPHLAITLEGKSFKQLLDECNDLRKVVEKELAIPTDISDEHFLMFYCAGIRSTQDILKAKEETMIDIVSCDYRRTREIAVGVNNFSQELSHRNE